jgi:large subunit ribosomal protein L23
MAISTAFIKKPWITEKATAGEAANQYVFVVANDASKPEIKKAVSALYKVDVVAVNVVNRPAKRKRFGGFRKGVQGGYRKAIVTIKEGQKIDTH